MNTLTTWNPFRELDEVQNRLGSFFTVLFAHGSGSGFCDNFPKQQTRKCGSSLARTNKKKERRCRWVRRCR